MTVDRMGQAGLPACQRRNDLHTLAGRLTAKHAHDAVRAALLRNRDRHCGEVEDEGERVYGLIEVCIDV